MKKILRYALILLIGFPFCSNAQDCISNFSLETQCIDAFNFSASLTFTHTLEDGDMITITDRNGVNYGYFNPNEQPIVLDILLPNSLMNEVSFTLKSINAPNCFASSPSSLVFCNECNLSARILSTDCMEDDDSYILELELINNGAMSVTTYYVKHKETGIQYGPFVSAKPGVLQTVEIELPYNQQGEFSVYDPNRLCLSIVSASNECNPLPSCMISNVTAVTACLAPRKISTVIEFDYNDTMDEMVTIMDSYGQKHGPFRASSQPIQIDTQLPDSFDNDIQFTVSSTQNNSCFATSSMQTTSCYSCDIEVQSVDSECIPGSDNYRLILGVQSVGDSPLENFKLTHTESGRFIGMFKNYAPTHPRIIQVNLPAELQGSFTISDDRDICMQTIEAGVDCSEPQCFISNVDFETECVDANSFKANVSFDFENMDSDFVYIKDVHGKNYGTFDATQQPIQLDVVLEETDNKVFGLFVYPELNEACLSESPLQTIQCLDCKLEAKILYYECDEANENYNIALEITNNGVTEGVKYLVTHTATGRFVGIYTHFGSSSIRLIEFYTTIKTQGEFTVTILETNCSTSINALVDCPDKNDCYIEDLSVKSAECNNDGTYNLNLSCTLNDSEGEHVKVSINGGETQLYYTTGVIHLENLVGGDQATYDTIVVCSNNDTECCLSIESQRPNCTSDENECDLSITNVAFECHTGMPGHLTLLVSVEGTSTNDYYVKVNGVETGVGNMTQTTTEVGPILAKEDGYYFIEVIDVATTTCEASSELQQAFCEEECKIGNVEVNTECLSNGFFKASITFLYENPKVESSIKLIGNGVYYGIFNVNDQPIVLDELKASDFDHWEFIVVDNNDDACQSKTEVGSIICEADLVECTLDNIVVYDLTCTSNNEYDMFLSFDFDSEQDMVFSCYINGVLDTNANTSILPMRMSGVTTENNNNVDVITICIDNMAEECCLDYTYEKPNCLSNSIINNSALESISISPNPARDIISIEDVPDNVTEIAIVDNIGRPMKKTDSTRDLVLDISEYPKGLYTIFFSTIDNRVITKRFIKL